MDKITWEPANVRRRMTVQKACKMTAKKCLRRKVGETDWQTYQIPRVKLSRLIIFLKEFMVPVWLAAMYEIVMSKD